MGCAISHEATTKNDIITERNVSMPLKTILLISPKNPTTLNTDVCYPRPLHATVDNRMCISMRRQMRAV